MRALGVSGSLKSVSVNTTALQWLQRRAPPRFSLELSDDLVRLPHFNPDLDLEPAIPSVDAWRRRIAASDGVLISSPEYAHGIPGALKNALDWLVSSAELYRKPIMLIGTARRAHHAREALTEVLQTMGAVVVTEAFLGSRSGPRNDSGGPR